VGQCRKQRAKVGRLSTNEHSTSYSNQQTSPIGARTVNVDKVTHSNTGGNGAHHGGDACVTQVGLGLVCFMLALVVWKGLVVCMRRAWSAGASGTS